MDLARLEVAETRERNSRFASASFKTVANKNTLELDNSVIAGGIAWKAARPLAALSKS